MILAGSSLGQPPTEEKGPSAEGFVLPNTDSPPIMPGHRQKGDAREE